MKFAVASLVGMALVATSLALPIDMGTGVDFGKDDYGFWNNQITIGGQPLQVGLDWNKLDGTVSAGAKISVDLNGEKLPITASVSSNINDPKVAKYQVGAKLNDRIGGVIQGDMKGAINYQINAWMPVTGNNGLSAFGASLEGENLKPTTLTGGVRLGGEVVRAKLSLDSDMKPSNFNVALGTD